MSPRRAWVSAALRRRDPRLPEHCFRMQVPHRPDWPAIPFAFCVVPGSCEITNMRRVIKDFSRLLEFYGYWRLVIHFDHDAAANPAVDDVVGRLDNILETNLGGDRLEFFRIEVAGEPRPGFLTQGERRHHGVDAEE